MKILIYGQQHERSQIQNSILSLPIFIDHAPEFCGRSQFDDFYIQLVDYRPDLIIVAIDGAEGMEGVRRSKRVLPDVPVFWFSNDRNFATEAYRLDCAYFSSKPVMSEKYQRAFARIGIGGGGPV